jgi:hypothetical protein
MKVTFVRQCRLVDSVRLAAVILAIGAVSATQGAVLQTGDAAQVALFQNGATIENFDDLPGLTITSYAAGQTVPGASQFSSRNGLTMPTFHSGGGSPNDPVGNPGTPIGIFAPSGGIAGDVASLNNVAGPLEINTDQAFNFGFMEVILPSDGSKIGFWVTHGTVTLTLRDVGGNDLTTGDFTVTGNAGEFIGLSRDAADFRVAALIGGEAFTIDDFTYITGTASSVPEPGFVLAGLLAGTLGWLARRRMGGAAA